jgi:hypothetical protein
VSVTASSTEIQTEQASAAVLEPPAAQGPSASAKAPAVDEQARASKQGGAGKASKDARSKKSKKPKEAPAAADAQGPSVAAHPRAARGVARARGWAGLGGFMIAGYLSLPTGTLASAGLRALIAGIVCYVVAWAGAVFLWRRLVMVELRAKQHALHASVNGHDPSLPAAGESTGARAAA